MCCRKIQYLLQCLRMSLTYIDFLITFFYNYDQYTIIIITLSMVIPLFTVSILPKQVLTSTAEKFHIGALHRNCSNWCVIYRNWFKLIHYTACVSHW